MNAEAWEILSAWLTQWMLADPPARAALRARLAADHPELLHEADALALNTAQLEGFLEIPAVVLAARDLAQESTLFPPGTMVGRYRVVELLARGGMGDVYRATDEQLHRDVAIKVLAESPTADHLRVDRFMQEARVTASLDHPNVVRVYDVGTIDERAYLVAELLDGETLRSRITRGPMLADDVLRIARDVARGLAAAHAAGLVHRDLKPDNIFLTRSGVTKILDFGIAKLAQDDAVVRDRFATLTGIVLGTAGYLAPEQVRGEAVDARADLFAMGAVIFEMLTGTRAFARDHMIETLHAILHDPPTGALAERVDVPPQLNGLVMVLLQKDPQARVQTSTELIRALERIDPSARSHRSAASYRWVALIVLGLAGLMFSRDYWWPPAPVRVAVMPFRTVPENAGDPLIELGMADVLIRRLSELSELEVLALGATSAADMRGKAATDVASSRDVDRVVQVILQKDGGRVIAATARVVSRAGGAPWTETIPAEGDGVEWVQKVLEDVVNQLAPRLSRASKRRVQRQGSGNAKAVDAYVRGRAEALNPTPASLKRAKVFFDEALNIEPSHPDALAGLGSVYKRLPIVAGVSARDAFPEAENQARRALTADAENGEAHSILGTVAFWYHWDYERAERELRRALQLQPSDPDSHLFLGHLLANTGRFEEALDHIRLAQLFDPSWPLPRAHEGHFLFMARRYDEASRRLEASTRMDPKFWPGQTFKIFPLLARGEYAAAVEQSDVAGIARGGQGGADTSSFKGYALARAGREGEALEILERIGQRADGQSAGAEALVLLGLRRHDEALDRLQRAVDEKATAVTFLGVYPWWDELRDHPRFKNILDQVHLLDVSERIRRLDRR